MLIREDNASSHYLLPSKPNNPTNPQLHTRPIQTADVAKPKVEAIDRSSLKLIIKSSLEDMEFEDKNPVPEEILESDN